MARFDIYRNDAGPGYLLDIQADLLSHLNTRIVIPLLPLVSAPKPASILNPLIEIDGIPHTMVTQFIAAVPLKTLKNPIVNASRQREAITSALDMLFQGF